MKNWIGVVTLLFAVQVQAGEINVNGAWARATAPGQENGSVGVIITSQKDARLIAVTTTVAESSEIHTMVMEGGVMKMRQLEFLALPANQPVTLGPGGDHLMLFGLKHALKAGEIVPLTLTVQFADKSEQRVKIEALVKSLTAMHGNHHH